MKFYELEPEVAGGLGKNTVMDRSVHPPRVSRLHYYFDGWLGDPLVESFPCFIVTELLRDEIVALHSTGVSFGTVELSKSGEFEDLHPNRQLPSFAWLQVTGKAGTDDFGLSTKHGLVVSGRTLEVLRKAGMSHCAITEFNI